ncbi:uncharacterized protein LOC108915403 [Anoplophora glabripennis]|uniref:uncharacterized protein LOC108915403 n=1 Tax=Anoplophora glabripennis TaxID=217634 RepID=UPI000874BA4D|nr:uncharacterized protein LOC108915403 [Anoplophora glabripennis]
MGYSTLYFYIFLLCICSLSSLPPEPNRTNRMNKHHANLMGAEENTKRQEEASEIHITSKKTIKMGKKDVQNTHLVNNEKKVDDKKTKNVSNNTVTTPNVLVNNANIKTGANAEIESGAVMRGIFVFVGITMICIMYIGFKTYFRKGNKKSPLIKKYGVKTRRSDIEMEPLPLDEDEEDETVFDLGNVTNR